MYIKILVYIIDNQRFKYKISTLFLACRSFAVPVSRSSWIGGAGPKTAARPGLFRGGGPSHISPHIPPILTTYPAYPNISGVPTYSYVHIPHPLTT